MQSQPNVIFCNFCGFGGFSFFQVARHLRLHTRASFRCGIEDCPYTCENLSVFRRHLQDFHSDIYPEMASELPDLVNSVFTYAPQEYHQSIQENIIEMPSIQEIETAYPNFLNNDDQVLDENAKFFAEILLVK